MVVARSTSGRSRSCSRPPREAARVVRRIAVRVPVRSSRSRCGRSRGRVCAAAARARRAPRRSAARSHRRRRRRRSRSAQPRRRRRRRSALAKRRTGRLRRRSAARSCRRRPGPRRRAAAATCGGNDATRFGRVPTTPSASASSSDLLVSTLGLADRRRVDLEVRHRLAAERLDELDAARRASAGRRPLARRMEVAGAQADDHRAPVVARAASGSASSASSAIGSVVAAELDAHAAVHGDGRLEQVHRRRADEAGDEEVRRVGRRAAAARRPAAGRPPA